jgi:hypothetical protein
MSSRPEPRTREVFKPTGKTGESVRYTREFMLNKPDEFWSLIIEQLWELQSTPGFEKRYFNVMRNEIDKEPG